MMEINIYFVYPGLVHWSALRTAWKAGAVFLVLYSSLVAWNVAVYNKSLAAQVPGLVEEFEGSLGKRVETYYVGVDNFYYGSSFREVSSSGEFTRLVRESGAEIVWRKHSGHSPLYGTTYDYYVGMRDPAVVDYVYRFRVKPLRWGLFDVVWGLG
jgi:hypothetical protein